MYPEIERGVRRRRRESRKSTPQERNIPTPEFLKAVPEASLRDLVVQMCQIMIANQVPLPELAQRILSEANEKEITHE